MFSQTVTVDGTLLKLEFFYGETEIKTVYVSDDDLNGLAEEIKNFYHRDMLVYKRLLVAFNKEVEK